MPERLHHKWKHGWAEMAVTETIPETDSNIKDKMLLSQSNIDQMVPSYIKYHYI